jgi:hypothetical protein
MHGQRVNQVSIGFTVRQRHGHVDQVGDSQSIIERQYHHFPAPHQTLPARFSSLFIVQTTTILVGWLRQENPIFVDRASITTQL